jgi:hypothetical protein
MFTAFFDVVSHNVAKTRWKGVNPLERGQPADDKKSEFGCSSARPPRKQ